MTIDRSSNPILEKVSSSWFKAAGVLSADKHHNAHPEPFDPALPDFPAKYIPVTEHDGFKAMPPEKKSEVATCAWISMNARIVAIEDGIVRPALIGITNHDLPGSSSIQAVLRQTQLDEDYHSLLHVEATARTRRERGYHKSWTVPTPVTLRRMEASIEDCAENWQKILVNIVFATVAEVSFNSFLQEMAENEDMQPFNRYVMKVHAKDEARHGSVFSECVGMLYEKLSPQQQDFFINAIPGALKGFLAEDWEGWAATLRHVGFQEPEKAIMDIHGSEPDGLISSEFAPVRAFLSKLGVLDRMNFDFTPIG